MPYSTATGSLSRAGYDGKLAYSSDGISWTAVVDTLFEYFYTSFGSFYINALFYGNGKFVAGGLRRQAGLLED